MNNETIVCDVCGAVVERNKYERHVKYGHKEKRENKCHLCHKDFTSLYNLQYHLAHHSNARNFLCNECPRAYNTAADLGQHQRIHEKQREPYKCNDCGMFFQIRSKFNTHMRIHQKAVVVKSPKECPLCPNKKFVCLSSHNRVVHLNVRTHECSDCGKTFGKKSGLDRHVLTVHQKVKRYKCDVEGCHGRGFGEKSHFLKHMKTHANKDPSYCSVCKDKFVDMKSHFETEHKDLRNHCKICFRRFVKHRSLKLHIKVFHTREKNFFCDYCPDKGFAERHQLERHMKLHQDRMMLDEKTKGYSMDLETEKIFVKVEDECLQEPPQLVDTFVEVKSEVVSDDEATPQVQIESEIKSEIAVESESEDNDDIGLTGNAFDESDIESDDEMNKVERKLFEELTTEVSCDICDLQFTGMDLLTAHIIAQHTKDQMKCDLECDVCGRNFRYKSVLERHVKVIHEKQHICSECGKTFGTLKELAKHEISHDDSKTLRRTCSTCGKVFSKERNLQMHILAIHHEKSFECETCGKKFSYESAKDRHVKVVHLNERSHQETSFVCETCGKTFSFESARDRHVKVVHENQRKHICSKCGRMFGTKYDLTKHYETNHDDSTTPQRTCSTCGKVFSKERNLQMHILAIHHEKSFECETCGKKFSFESAKDRHVKVVHLNQRSHKCSFCKKTFGVKNDLRDHLAFRHSSESGERGKYFCTTCERHFASASGLSRHIKGVHENIKQNRPRDYRCKFCKEVMSNKYQREKHLAQVHQDGLKTTRTCHVCNSTFQLFTDFKSHIESHAEAFICLICGTDHHSRDALSLHSEEHKHIDVNLRRYICDFCDHRIFNKIQLKVHMRKHMTDKNFYVCDICGQGYKYISPFLYHKKVHEGTKDFICTHCGKSFMRKPDLIVHTRSHTQEKPFKCTVCDKRFGSKLILYVHLQTHSATRKVFTCKDCNLTFTDRNQSKLHDETFHPDRRPFWCNICKKSFKFEHLLKTHKKHKHKPNETFEVDIVPDPSQFNEVFNIWNH